MGSDLCFSIRSVLLVEELMGDKLEERGVRGRGGLAECARGGEVDLREANKTLAS